MTAALVVLILALSVAPAMAQQTVTKEDLDKVVSSLLSLPGVPADVVKQHEDIAKELSELKTKMVDLAVPDSPAFTVLGLTPEEVARPTTGRALAAALLNGVDRRGVLQSGVAFDTLPYLALAGNLLTLDSYRGRNNYHVRFLARTQLSVATAKASDQDDKAMRLALGVRMTIFDQGDPRTDTELDKCVGIAIALPEAPKFLPPPLPDQLDEASLKEWQGNVARGKKAVEEYEARVAAWKTTSAAAVRECREQARKRAWNRTKWIVAVAPAWKSPTGAAADLDGSGSGVWTTFGYGFEEFPGLKDHAQLLVHARYRNNELVADPADAAKQITQDSRLFGVQVRAGTKDSSIAGEAIYERSTPAAAASITDHRYSIGYERRLASNLWLGLAVGSGRPAAGETKKSGFVLSSFKWGFAESSSLGVPQ